MARVLQHFRRPREVRIDQERVRRGGVVRAPVVKHSPTHKLIERGLNGDRCGGALASTIARLVTDLDREQRQRLRRILYILERNGSPLLTHVGLLGALAPLARAHGSWIRRPDDWTTAAQDAGEDLASLLRHLLCRYPVPRSFDWAWLHVREPMATPGRRWFIHIGQGGSFRTAPALPHPISKTQAHQILRAPADVTLPQAFVWGRLVAAHVNEQLAGAVIATPLGRHGYDNVPGVGDGAGREELLALLAPFLAACPDFPTYQVHPLIDYVTARRRGAPPFNQAQRDFALAGRSVESVLRDINGWHDQLAQSRNAPADLVWPLSGIAWLTLTTYRPPRDGRWRIVELTSTAELLEEGRAMRHCVGSYARGASAGRYAIFSLRHRRFDAENFTRVATIEVTLADRTVVQARGPSNMLLDEQTTDVLRRWCSEVGLDIARRLA